MRDIDLPAVLGLTGYASSGKDAVADILAEEFGYERVAFADPVKRVAYCIGWDGTKRAPSTYAPGNLNGRLLLQELGMACREHIAPDVFVVVAERRIEEVLQRGGRVVLPDVRFANEVELVHSFYGTVVRVERPGVEPMKHASEQIESLVVDASIRNGGSLLDLRVSVRRALELMSVGDSS